MNEILTPAPKRPKKYEGQILPKTKCYRARDGKRCLRPYSEHVNGACPDGSGAMFRWNGAKAGARRRPIAVGDVFVRWTVVAIGDPARPVCRCVCGTTTRVFATHLRRGNSKGCTSCAVLARGDRLHDSGTRSARSSWEAMLSRCSDPRNNSYRFYGARGVAVCERWLSFDNFLADMGPRPSGKTLDRIDSARGYEPGNCRWATPTEQIRNRSNTVRLTALGETLCAAEWSARTGVPLGTLYARLNKGWSHERAITEPLHAYQPRGAK